MKPVGRRRAKRKHHTTNKANLVRFLKKLAGKHDG